MRGPWWEGEINAELFEAVLTSSRAQGTVRLLLAAMAALANEGRVVEGVTTERLCAAAGVTDRTYRRARTALLASGEVVLRGGAGGRGNTNCWELPDPQSRAGDTQPVARRRTAPPPGQRPLLASVRSGPAAAAEKRGGAADDQATANDDDQRVGVTKGGPGRMVSGEECPVAAGVSAGKGGGERTLSSGIRPAAAGVSAGKAGADRTLFAETPAKTPAGTPAPNARAGREPQNPRTPDPPSPPGGGSFADRVLVDETYVTERGRRRRRVVAVDLGVVRARLRAARGADRAAWEQVRALLREAVGESTFEIWLAPLELLAVDLEGTLVVSAPPETVGWVARRFGRILDSAGDQVGCQLRVADELERKAAESLSPIAAAAPADVSARESGEGSCDFPVGGSSRGCVDTPVDGSAYPSSYTDVYTQLKEVS